MRPGLAVATAVVVWSAQVKVPMDLAQSVASAVRQIVEVADPDRVILFGSAARGTAGPDSDIDLLVIKPGVHRRRLAMEIYRHLRGVERGVDVVVVTPEDVERYRDCPYVVLCPALREGQVVYERNAPTIA